MAWPCGQTSICCGMRAITAGLLPMSDVLLCDMAMYIALLS